MCCDVRHTVHDNVVGPDALAEAFRVGPLCLDQLLKPILDCVLPSNAVTGLLLEPLLHRALQPQQLRACTR